MAKTPNWIRRRISDRPVARWISWESGRPVEAGAEVAAPAPAAGPKPQPEARFEDAGNVVYFKRSA